MKHLLLSLLAFACAMTAGAQSLKQWRDSLEVINGKINLHPDSLGLQLEKAAVNLQLLEWEDAADACGRVLEADHDNLPALFYRAFANNNLRRYALAKSDYEHFLSLSPRNMEARLGLAYTYERLGRTQEASDQLNNLVEMFPDSGVIYAARAEFEKGMKQYDVALYDIDEALKREPGNRDYIVSKVEMLLLSERKREAKRVLDDAVRNGVPRGILLEWYAKCK